MNVFEAVKQNLTTRQAAEMYGIKVNRNGMVVCPFHNDRNPSMKLDKRFHCFACQADGDVVDFVSRLFGLPSKAAAMKMADYLHHLRTWKQQYAPKQLEDEWHLFFVEALQRESHIEYLLYVLLYGTAEEKKALVAEQRKKVMNLEQRFAKHPDEHDRGGSQRKSGFNR